MRIHTFTARIKSAAGYVYELNVDLDENDRITDCITRLEALFAQHGIEPTTGYTSRTPSAPQPAGPQPAAPQPTEEIEIDLIRISYDKGKYYAKAIGAPFNQFGISIWPEVLSQIGLEIGENLVLGDNPTPGMIGRFTRDPETNNPKKIVALSWPEDWRATAAAAPLPAPPPPPPAPSRNGKPRPAAQRQQPLPDLSF